MTQDQTQTKPNRRGLLIILSSPSGAGKSTLAKQLMAWDPSIRNIYHLPARLQMEDVMSAVSLSLGLSFIVTIFPARRAARMNPVEALRYE